MKAGRIQLADTVTVAILTVINLTLAIRALQGVPLGTALTKHLVLEAVFAGLVAAMVRHPRQDWIAWARPIAVVATMFTLYGSLGHVAFAAIPWCADPWLDSAERALFGGNSPTLALESLSTPAVIEILALFYALFIPFLYLAIFNGLVGRLPSERDRFLDGLALVYAFGFLGYLFLPAKGPVDYLADAVSGPLQGGFFHGLVLHSIDMVGGPHGAMPSLHIGASLYVCAMEIHHGRKRGWIALPFVAVLYVATVFLRYHYVIDLLAGTAIALVAVRIAVLWSQSRTPFPHPAAPPLLRTQT